MEKNYSWVNPGTPLKKIFELTVSRNLRQIPVLDPEKKVLALETFFGKYLNPVFEDPLFILPKKASHSLGSGRNVEGLKKSLEMTDRFEKIRDAGFSTIFFPCKGKHQEKPFELIFPEKEGKKCRVEGYHEIAGDSIVNFLEKRGFINPESLIVFLEDYLPINKIGFQDILNHHRVNHSDMTLGVITYRLPIPFGVTRVQEHSIARLVEKPVCNFIVSAGIYVASISSLKKVKPFYLSGFKKMLKSAIRSGMVVNAFHLEDAFFLGEG
jgi:hypothetical protein